MTTSSTAPGGSMAARAHGAGRVAVLAAASLAVLSFAVRLASPALARPAAPTGLSAIELGIVDDINAVRQQYGLGALEPAAALMRAASAHCQQQVEAGYFGHQSAAGAPFAARMSYYYPADGAGYYAVGENLLWTTASMDADRVVAAWMASPPHRANILSPTWRQIGVGALSVTSAPGAYGGRAVTVFTVDFGVRD